MGRKRTLVVEFYAGPSVGKSTDAADLYQILKKRGIDAEMSREYVKRWAWEGRGVEALDEFYIFAKQVREESVLLGKVDVVVSDRPVLMSAVYADLYAPAEIRDGVVAAVRSYYSAAADAGHRRVAVLLPRIHQYVEAGRFEDEAGALLVDRIVENWVGAMMLEDAPRRHTKAPVIFDGLYRFCSAPFVGVADVAVDVDRLISRRIANRLRVGRSSTEGRPDPLGRS
jgi:hypothetical protein